MPDQRFAAGFLPGLSVRAKQANLTEAVIGEFDVRVRRQSGLLADAVRLRQGFAGLCGSSAEASADAGRDRHLSSGVDAHGAQRSSSPAIK